MKDPKVPEKEEEWTWRTPARKRAIATILIIGAGMAFLWSGFRRTLQRHLEMDRKMMATRSTSATEAAQGKVAEQQSAYNEGVPSPEAVAEARELAKRALAISTAIVGGVATVSVLGVSYALDISSVDEFNQVMRRHVGSFGNDMTQSLAPVTQYLGQTWMMTTIREWFPNISEDEASDPEEELEKLQQWIKDTFQDPK